MAAAAGIFRSSRRLILAGTPLAIGFPDERQTLHGHHAPNSSAPVSMQKLPLLDVHAFKSLLLPFRAIGHKKAVECQRKPRPTEELESSLIQKQDWSPDMLRISRAVNFQSILAEACFLTDGVAPETISSLAAGLECFATKNTVLIEEGAANSAVYAVGQGLLHVKVNGVHVKSIGPGEVVGLYTMLKKTNASATVTVESETAYLLQLRHDRVLKCLENNPDVMDRMKMIVHQREMQNKGAEMVNANIRPSSAAGFSLEASPEDKPRPTEELEFALIHVNDWTPEMWRVSGAVDFQSILEEACFLVTGVDPQVLGRLAVGLKCFAIKGTVLIEEGAENSAVYAVGHGLLSVKVNGVEVDAIGPGRIIGLYAMLKNSKASATVTVESETAYLMQLRHGHFMNCLDDNPAVMARMQMMLRQREMQNKAAEMVKPKA